MEVWEHRFHYTIPLPVTPIPKDIGLGPLVCDYVINQSGGRCCEPVFFGHRPKRFWNDRKNGVISVRMFENTG